MNINEIKKLSGKPVTLVWSSTPKLKGGKKNPQQGLVTKTTVADVTLSSAGSYGQRKVTEGEYDTIADVKPRAWGSRVGETCVIEHKGNFYVEFYLEGESQTTYYLDGNIIPKDDVEGLPENKRDSEVKISTIKIENLSSVIGDGVVLGADTILGG